MKWFKHLVDSGDDPDIGAIINRFGPRGYYMFFRTLEIMAREFSIHHPGRNVFQIRWLLRRYNCQIGKKILIDFLRFTNKIGRIRCRINRDTVFLNCPKLKDLADEYTSNRLKTIVSNSKQKSGVSHAQNKKKNKKENKSKNNKENNIKEKPEIESEFEEFWSAYREIGNKKDDIGDKGEALKAYKALRKKEEKKIIVKATNGYADFLKCKRLEENFKQRKMYASTFLRSERWKRYVDFEYKGRL